MEAYSVADATADVDCMLRDFQSDFVMDNWMDVTNFQQSVLSNNNSNINNKGNKTGENISVVCRKVSEYNSTMKYLKFASAALGSASLLLSCNTNVCSDQGPSATDQINITQPLDQADFLSKVPFSVSVAKLMEKNLVLRDLCDSEITAKQLQKDIERDRLVVDGRRISGSNEGIDFCLSAVEDAVDRCVGNCLLPPLPPLLREHLAREVLSTVSRTNSGGVALHVLRTVTGTLVWSGGTILSSFHTLHHWLHVHTDTCAHDYVAVHAPIGPSTESLFASYSLCCCRCFVADQDTVMLFPNSTEAGSLLVKVSMGEVSCSQDTIHSDSAPQTPPSRWGLRCEVQASTVYHVTALSDPDTMPDLDPATEGENSIEVVYRNRVCLVMGSEGNRMEAGGGVMKSGGEVSFQRFKA